MNESIKQARIDLWVKAWVSVAGTGRALDTGSCTRWADAAVKDFDERFAPKPTCSKCGLEFTTGDIIFSTPEGLFCEKCKS